jgi:hypothetical protein
VAVGHLRGHALPFPGSTPFEDPRESIQISRRRFIAKLGKWPPESFWEGVSLGSLPSGDHWLQAMGKGRAALHTQVEVHIFVFDHLHGLLHPWRLPFKEKETYCVGFVLLRFEFSFLLRVSATGKY